MSLCLSVDLLSVTWKNAVFFFKLEFATTENKIAHLQCNKTGEKKTLKITQSQRRLNYEITKKKWKQEFLETKTA